MADPNADLLGNISVADQAGAIGAEAAARGPDHDEDDRVEQELVSKLLKEYTAAREFDKEARIQYARDRRYAAGTADQNWASDANLTGSFIDILVSFLYAQNPDAGVRAAAQIEGQPDPDASKFAETLELVVDKLWRDGNLKRMGKKWVRSALTVGAGWLKATMLTQKIPSPQLDHKLNTLQDQMQSIVAKQKEIAEGDDPGADDTETQTAQLQIEMDGIQAQLLKKKRFGLMCDYVRAEDVQVSLNISDLADYTEADWISTDIYVVKDTLKERFPDLDDDDIKSTATYYQRNVPSRDESTDAQSGESGEGAGEGQFSKSTPNSSYTAGSTQGKPVEFAKIIEVFDRRDFMVKTMLEGVKEWATDPYPPPQASSRFYPFFYLAFFPVDGKRHGQSLPWRLHKLQDEFASCRSNQRLTRERSVTGVIFNSAAIDPDDAKRIVDANQQELIGVRTVADQPLGNVFIAKPVGSYNPELYNTASIRSDMEAVAGIQEALQQNAQTGGVQPKTATEAQIQQQGFTSRTGADRDVLETALTELSHYTAEVSTQECTVQWVQRVCGKKAFWLGPNLGEPPGPPGPPDPTTGLPTPGKPAVPPSPGMDVEDVLTMVEVSIDAGTTGKPNFAADKAAWATILPLLEKSLVQIRQAQLHDPGLADSLIRVLQETLHRMDDRLDLDEFIPQGEPSLPPPEAPKMTVSIQLKGAITPEQEAMLLGAEAELHHIPMPGQGGAPGGAPPGVTGTPGAPNMAPGVAPGIPHGLPIPSHIPGTAMPMPALSLEKHTAPKPAAPPSK